MSKLLTTSFSDSSAIDSKNYGVKYGSGRSHIQRSGALIDDSIRGSQFNELEPISWNSVK